MAFRPILLVSALTLVSASGACCTRSRFRSSKWRSPAPTRRHSRWLPGRPLRTGTGRIRGRVLSESGAPVRRAPGPDLRSRHRRPDRHHRRRRPLRVPRSAGWPVHGQRLQGRLRDGAVRADAAARAGQADRAGRQADARQGRPGDVRAAARSPGGSSTRAGEPVADAVVTAMRSEWAAGHRRLVNAGRIGADQRPRPVPDVRPATRRLLRQRHASQHRRADARHDGAVGPAPAAHRGGRVRLCAVVLPGHGVERRRPEDRGRARSGSARHRLSARPGPSRPRSAASSSTPRASRSRARWSR